jgi:predicted ATPase/DNA-binding SARP family transcriptional activator
MEFRILGPLEVAEGGGVLPLGPPLRRLLLAVLLCQPNQAVALDRLIDLLWPGPSPRTAAKNVQVHVYQLRKTLGADRIRRDPHGYRLLVEPGERDADLFQEAATAGMLTLRSGNAQAARTALHRALGHWRGPTLAGLADTVALRQEAGRWESRRLEAVEALAESELLLGGRSGLVEELRQHVAADPLRERFRAQLMRALYLAGRRSEALEVYQDGRRLLVEELGLEPGTELHELQQAILAGVPVDRAPANHLLPGLPPQVRPELIGREADVTEVRSLLAASQLVTLTGAPGTGKTRLALEVADRMRGDFPDGQGLVRLDAVADPDRLPAAVVIALGLPDDPLRTPGQTLAGALAHANALVVLDNCEHLAAAVADLLREVLAQCPRLRVLATSREPLDIGPERVHVVRPLAVPAADTVEAVEDSPAGRLLVSRARRSDPDFRLTAANAADVAHVCRALDGLPLAIELAAGRLRALTVWQVAERLDRQLDTLGSRAGDSRHKSLRAALDWSYRLLPEVEQRTFARLSVFLGGFSLDAAEAVAGDVDAGDAAVGDAGAGEVTAGDAGAVLNAVAGLVERSLLVAEVDSTRPKELRYRMLEALRQYAAEQLAADPDARAVHLRHARYFCELAERSERERRGPSRPGWVERLQLDYPNLRGATLWAHGNGEYELSLRFVGAMWWFWTHEAAGEGIACVRVTFGALAKSDAEPSAGVLQRALFGAGTVAFRVDIDECRAYLRRAVELAEEHDDRPAQIPALVNLARAEWVAGNWPVARAHGEHAVELARRHGDAFGLARALVTRGMMVAYLGESGGALGREPGGASGREPQADLAESLELYQKLGDELGIFEVTAVGADIARINGDVEALSTVLTTISARTAVDALGSDYAVTWLAQAWLGHAWLALTDGDHPAVTGHLATAFTTIGRLHLGPFIAQRVVCPGLTIAAAHALSGGDAAGAVTILTAARAVLPSFGTVAPPPVARWEEDLLRRARRELGDETFERATADGSVLDLPGLLRLAGLPISPAWDQSPSRASAEAAS